ncbi:MAG: endonuclease III [Gammaproteobacteria bacterium]|nr:MAG: endonuclease III [Gammaproteobacteria bacterium]
MKKADIKEIFELLKADNPSPTTELIFNSPFELLIAVILSAQATDTSVNKVTPALFKAADSPEKIFKLGEKGLKPFIKSIGLFNSKAANIIKTCKILSEQFNGEIPNNREDLESLPGVGRKTANVILNTVFRQPTMAVDTHIFRVSRRIGLSDGSNVLQVEKDLLKNIPDEYMLDAHHWLLLHGRYVCTARNPKCEACIISDLCMKRI